ncbi:lipoprotein [Streptantibioticus cattleyicolor NRRL 8057 = DSM 46488]|uniref:Lipoprotein n=1 Tax=Streptantibioticus cattleyicolor (strain ATCC 35852 / DSM 46488 / JCM 4925 / NBRC 14057 / NRRL 8057) TaxID=1003195 RepID=G8X324_STREN|nr:lipoprotein [Streptantibioticus cattleyicolor NRRL 8057 = DSM 46488]MYS60682.1 hypothetical protein [Streptomyces sp. SID5468]
MDHTAGTAGLTRRGWRAAGAALLLGTVAAGCGIRATSVPVDAGAAPSRVSCAVPEAAATATARPGTTTAAVYLVCSQRVSPVQRVVARPGGDRLATARLLLAELERKPDPAEEHGGFTSEVPGGLAVRGPADGDPPEALRLSQDPDDLPSYAVGQLVCTFAGTAAGAGDRSVVLGGPDPHHRVERYRCDDALRTQPLPPSASTPSASPSESESGQP